MNEEKTRKCLRLLEHIRGHLWDTHFVAVDQVLTFLPSAELSRLKAKRQINLYLWYPLSQDQTYNYLVKCYHQYSGTWYQRIDRVIFLSFSLYEVCLIRIKEQVIERRSTVCTHWNADCLLQNTSIKQSKYVVYQKLEHVDVIRCRRLFVRIRVAKKKMCPFPRQGSFIIIIYYKAFI